jgi:PAS domain S-box-containing protein
VNDCSLSPSALSAFGIVETMFDDISDTIFFVKDDQGLYLIVNRPLASRCGLAKKSDAIGRSADQVFDPPYGEIYAEQDELVLRTGRRIKDKLELQIYSDGTIGWCITNKMPIRSGDGNIVGMIGMSKDLHIGTARAESIPELAAAVAHIQKHYDQPLRITHLAKMTSLSIYQFEKRMKKVFHMTAGQFIMQTRIDAARDMLAHSPKQIVKIALECGFCDQSAFARQFKQVTGLTPSAFRKLRSS